MGAFFGVPRSMVTTLFASHSNDKYGQIYVINCKFINKNNFFSHVDTKYRQIRWEIRIFSTHRKSEKKLPYGTFFSHAEIYGLNTFWIALQTIIMDNFIFNLGIIFDLHQNLTLSFLFPFFRRSLELLIISQKIVK